MSIRVMFFKENGETILPSLEAMKYYKQVGIKDPFTDKGCIDIDTKEDSTYLDLLFHSDVIQLFDGDYKIKNRTFRAVSPLALWVTVGEKIISPIAGNEEIKKFAKNLQEFNQLRYSDK